jgi:hypothetical protein
MCDELRCLACPRGGTWLRPNRQWVCVHVAVCMCVCDTDVTQRRGRMCSRHTHARTHRSQCMDCWVIPHLLCAEPCGAFPACSDCCQHNHSQRPANTMCLSAHGSGLLVQWRHCQQPTTRQLQQVWGRPTQQRPRASMLPAMRVCEVNQSIAHGCCIASLLLLAPAHQETACTTLDTPGPLGMPKTPLLPSVLPTTAAVFEGGGSAAAAATRGRLLPTSTCHTTPKAQAHTHARTHTHRHTDAFTHAHCKACLSLGWRPADRHKGQLPWMRGGLRAPGAHAPPGPQRLTPAPAMTLQRPSQLASAERQGSKPAQMNARQAPHARTCT